MRGVSRRVIIVAAQPVGDVAPIALLMARKKRCGIKSSIGKGRRGGRADLAPSKLEQGRNGFRQSFGS